MDTTKPLKWADLPNDKKEEIRDFYSDMKLLIEFGNKATGALFIYLYGEHLGTHLWEKFCRTDRNITKFIGLLDTENQATLLTNVLVYKNTIGAHPLYAHC